MKYVQTIKTLWKAIADLILGNPGSELNFLRAHHSGKVVPGEVHPLTLSSHAIYKFETLTITRNYNTLTIMMMACLKVAIMYVMLLEAMTVKVNGVLHYKLTICNVTFHITI